MKWSFGFVDLAKRPAMDDYGWQLFCGDMPTNVYIPEATQSDAEAVAKLLSYESATPYTAKYAKIPELVEGSIYFTHAGEYYWRAIAIPPAMLPLSERSTAMQEVGVGHCRRLTEASELTPEELEAAATAGAEQEKPAVDAGSLGAAADAKAAEAAAEKVFSAAKQEDGYPGNGRASLVHSGDGEKLSIVNCHACDARHDGIPFHEYKTPNPPYTHWFLCPRTGDPVMVALVQNSAGDFVELHNNVLRHLLIAQAAGQFLVAVFRIEDNKVKLAWVKHRFPNADITADDGKKIGNMLNADLIRDLGPLMPSGPLKEAKPQQRKTLGNFFQRAAGPEGRSPGSDAEEPKAAGTPEEIPSVPVAD